METKPQRGQFAESQVHVESSELLLKAHVPVRCSASPRAEPSSLVVTCAWGPPMKKHLAWHRRTVAPQFWKITLDRKSTNFIYFRCSVSSFLDMNSLKIRNLDGAGGGLVVRSCPTLYDPTDCSLPGSSVHEILSARILESVAIPFSRGSSQPRDQTSVSFVSFLAPLPRRCHQKPWKKLKPDQASFFKMTKK